MRDSLVLCLRYALRYFFNLKFEYAVDSSLGSSNTSLRQGSTSADTIAHTDICIQFILEVRNLFCKHQHHQHLLFQIA